MTAQTALGVGSALWTANARTVLGRRYLRKDSDGVLLEAPEEMLARVAHAVAEAERAYGADPKPIAERFLRALSRLEFLPNSPTLMNAGRELGQLSACFVLPVGDSMPEIFDAVKWAAIIQQTGGGTGFSFSRLRPSGDVVNSTRGAASGPVSFIEVFNSATQAIRQGGVRRGANMAVLRVDHPDILEFIAAKADPARLTNFNVSVAVTDRFMAAVKADGEYELISPRNGGTGTGRRLRARRVWELIAQLAWKSGEPGVIFIDRVNRDNPTPALGEMESTNPCGELPLLPFESCNLGSIDVAKFVREGDFDWPRLAECVHLAVRFLDDVIDVNRYPLPQIEEITRGNRKIGVGVMGLADAFIELGLAYDSDDAVKMADKLSAFIGHEADRASEELAEVRGAFSNFAQSRWAKAGNKPRRNATTTTIAPTGTLSILAGCSGGIEPLYAIAFQRHVLSGTRLDEVHPQFVARAQREGWYSAELMSKLAERGSAHGMGEVPAQVRRLFVTAYDVAPKWHLEMQAAFQRNVQNAVSKTINFPHSATAADVESSYARAFELGLKGVTVYRDGSREEQVLSFGDTAKKTDLAPAFAPTTAAALSTDEGCPECGQPIAPARQGACSICLACGYTRCL